MLAPNPWEPDEDDRHDGIDHARTAEAARRAGVKERLRLSRLRMYSYCMTLSACVLALMAFMYLLTGASDRDPAFTSIGVMFSGMMILMLWAAMRVTRAGEGR